MVFLRHICAQLRRAFGAHSAICDVLFMQLKLSLLLNAAQRLKSRLKFRGISLVFSLFCAAGMNANAQVLYGVGNATLTNANCGPNTTLYTVSPTTGAATAITTTMQFASVALAVNPLNGLVFYVEQSVANPRVAVFNPAAPATAHTILANSPAIPLSASGAGVLRASFSADGRLYIATNSGIFYEISPTTGLIIRSFDTNLPVNGSGDFAFAPNGDLYVIANDVGATTAAPLPYQLWRFAAADVVSGATAPSTTAISGTAVGANIGQPNTVVPNGIAVIPPTGTCTDVCFAISTGVNNVTYLLDGTSGAATPLGAGTTGQCLTDLGRGYFTDLAIQKTGPATYIAGGAVSYTIRVWNNGPATPIAGSTISDVVPANLTGVSWTCVASGTASCGAQTSGTGSINHTSSSLTLDPAPTNAANTNFLTFTINATAGAAAPGMTNTATITAPAAVSDTNTANNSATVNSNVTADVAVNKTVAPVPYLGGSPLTYTIKVWNRGPNPISAVSVADTFPTLAAGATNWSYNCVASGTATCGGIPTALTTGNSLSALTGLLPINASATPPTTGSFLTITATATLAAGQIGTLNNTATVTLPAGATDPTPANNTSTAVDFPPVAGLTITKSDAKATTIDGATNTYTITVANTGPDPANGAVVTDPAVAGLTCSTVTCAVTSGAAVCPAAPTVGALQGAGINVPTFPAASSVTFTLTCTATATGG